MKICIGILLSMYILRLALQVESVTSQEAISRILRRPQPSSTFSWLLVTVSVCCVIDAYLTLEILRHGGVELNPVMDWFIRLDHEIFFVFKYCMTVTCMLFLAIFSRHRCFGIPAPWISFCALGSYGLLMSYEIFGFVYFHVLHLRLPVEVTRCGVDCTIFDYISIFY